MIKKFPNIICEVLEHQVPSYFFSLMQWCSQGFQVSQCFSFLSPSQVASLSFKDSSSFSLTWYHMLCLEHPSDFNSLLSLSNQYCKFVNGYQLCISSFNSSLSSRFVVKRSPKIHCISGGGGRWGKRTFSVIY